MDLTILTTQSVATIPGFPEITGMSSRGRSVSFKYTVDEAVYEGSADWRVSTREPEQGFALGHIIAGKQQWMRRLYKHGDRILVFSVGLPNTGRPHKLFECLYDASSRYGTCSLCGVYGILKQGEYDGMLDHIMRCASCRLLPCGEPTAPFNEELALSS